MSTTPSVALLDADILLYIASRGAEEIVDWEDGTEPMRTADLEKAKTLLKDGINAWHQMSGCDTYAICLSDRDNPCFRNEIYPIYKKQREAVDKPSLYIELTEWLKNQYEVGNWRIHPTLEADDVLGIIQTGMPAMIDTVIVSIDKDMLTIPGKHLNPNKDDGVIEIDLDTANYNWMTQTLTGDRVDNYKGAPGIGPKAAAKYLDAWRGDLLGMWDAVCTGFLDQWDKPNWRAKFQFADDPLREALANAQCARILRAEDYDTQSGKVKLWNPN